MRKSEILNLVWSDIDFDNKEIEVNPKANTDYTWAWEIKDTDASGLPLFLIPVVMRVYRTYSPCLEQGGA
jgi:integrase